MRLFRVTKDYLKEIQKISLFIPQQEEVLGTVLRINGYIYFLPINNEIVVIMKVMVQLKNLVLSY